MKRVVLIAVTLGASFAAIQGLQTPFPYVWGGLALSAALLFRWAEGGASWVAYNLIFVFLVLGGIEIYLDQGSPSKPRIVTTHDPEDRNEEDDILGYFPIPSTRVYKRKVAYLPEGGEEIIIDKYYTIDENSRRITPPRRGDESSCVLFFGCSLTFGSGVEDEEVAAHLTATLSQGRVATINFGYPGYMARTKCYRPLRTICWTA